MCLHTTLSIIFQVIKLDIKNNIDQYLDNLLQFKVDQIDQKRLKLGGLSNYILDILFSSKFRMGEVNPEFKISVERKINESIKLNSPIHVVVADGGFKNHKCVSAPNIDFAELMQVIFVINKLSPISQMYKPGLRIEYTHDAHIMNYIDNVDLNGINQYVEQFSKMLRRLEKLVPKNVSLSNTSFKDFYNLDEMSERIEAEIGKNESKYFSETDFKKKLNNARNNYITSRKERDFDYELKKSVLKHKVWMDIDVKERFEYLEGQTRIPILHKIVPEVLPIFSYKGSNKQYWISNGVFTNSGTNFELITPNNLRSKKLKKLKLKSNVLGMEVFGTALIL